MANFFDNKARAAAASSSKSKPTAEPVVTVRSQPWVEKYRPRSLDEVKSQEHATDTLRRMVNASNLPHLLLYGPPGSGKTSAILALCRELFGPELFSSRVLELNASDERSITVVREKIKTFAALHLSNAPTTKEYQNRRVPPFKVVLLDEADQLSQDAQGALRRVIEIYSKTTRFCLCCNYVSRVIAPLASRCSKFRFKALEGPQATERVAYILQAENVSYDSGVIERSLKVSDGDLRRAINLLQSAARLVGAATPASNGHASKKKSIPDDSDEDMEDVDEPKPTKVNSIKVSDIDEISGVFPTNLTDHLFKTLQQGNTRNYNTIATEIADITASGYSANEVLLSLYNRIVFDELVDNKKKYKLTQIFSEFDRRLIDGVDEQLSILDVSCQIAGVLSAK